MSFSLHMRRLFVLTICYALVIFPLQTSRGAVVTLKNNMQLEGKVGKIHAIGQNPLTPDAAGGPIKVTSILIIDDELRRMFVPTKQVINAAEAAPVVHERIKIKQRVATSGRRVAGVGPIIRITPFDEWGRRIFSMKTPRGQVDIVQGITEVTPSYCKVEGLLGSNAYVWDMRIRTSSIPRATLSKILYGQIDPKNPDERQRVVQLYIQAGRYQDAGAELAQIIEEFPELRDKEKQVRSLRQSGARRLIEEIEMRRESGQHALAINMLQNFPVDGVAGETLILVRELLGEYEAIQAKGKKVLELLQQHMGELKDAELRDRLKSIHEEIAAELNIHTLGRMADYLRLADDKKLTAEQKLSLAISGWLLGVGSGTENMGVSRDLPQVRDLVREYLRAVHAHERDDILAKLETLEGSTPSYLAKLLAHMKPAIEPPTLEENAVPGFYTLTTPGIVGEPDVKYHVQLPPGYDPYQHYPCVVTLNGSGTNATQQLEWWAGTYNEKMKMRTGQATRHGYIVIAPVWSKEHQTKYKYSAQEHAAVLHSLRDACRQFSIDTDRVFLSGHSMGGDAAWDIGLAHPDLWAGVMPVVATKDKYISHYYENARNTVPFYFVGGQLDGDRMEKNKMDLNRYMQYAGFDVIVVQYQGRGHEHFQDEIQSLFKWMNLQERDFYPRDFKAMSMRPWDNFFWWVELDEFPERSMVSPAKWPEAGKRAASTEAKVLETNGVHVDTAASKATIWLSPDIVDFEKRITINRRSQAIQPSSQTMLEDVRTRGDRQHPFWAKVEID